MEVQGEHVQYLLEVPMEVDGGNGDGIPSGLSFSDVVKGGVCT